eukprot:m.26681 g.26681  ORF g.26681 m.26681 type:complete len:77 (+) comp29467_c0_seq1:94-324(+)
MNQELTYCTWLQVSLRLFNVMNARETPSPNFIQSTLLQSVTQNGYNSIVSYLFLALLQQSPNCTSAFLLVHVQAEG